MKLLEVLPLIHLHKNSSLTLISKALDAQPQQVIDIIPWSDKQDKPEVKFAMAYNKDRIFLKYYVIENTVQAKYRNINSPVYKDSCVEFFIAFNNDKEYYNLEFNCLGTCLAGFGRNQHHRKLLPESIISKIRSCSTLNLGKQLTPPIAWQLTLVIPAEVFSEHRIENLTGEQAKVNFYKCGDELPEPHYLTWNYIDYPQPNFHLPEFFGEMQFL